MSALHAIVLAGGRARHLGGTDKVMIPVGGRPLLAGVVAALDAAKRVVVGPPRPVELEARIVFRGVDMRPGHPASLAVLPDGRPWLALPGNPLAAAMTALSFVPALSAGYRCDDVPPLDSAEVAEPFTSRAGTTLVPAIRTEAGLVAASAARSHMLRGLAEADVVAVAPSEGVTAGGSVRVLPRVW